jgi:hypothetical protein
MDAGTERRLKVSPRADDQETVQNSEKLTLTKQAESKISAMSAPPGA